MCPILLVRIFYCAESTAHDASSYFNNFFDLGKNRSLLYNENPFNRKTHACFYRRVRILTSHWKHLFQQTYINSIFEFS